MEIRSHGNSVMRHYYCDNDVGLFNFIQVIKYCGTNMIGCGGCKNSV